MSEEQSSGAAAPGFVEKWSKAIAEMDLRPAAMQPPEDHSNCAECDAAEVVVRQRELDDSPTTPDSPRAKRTQAVPVDIVIVSNSTANREERLTAERALWRATKRLADEQAADALAAAVVRRPPYGETEAPFVLESARALLANTDHERASQANEDSLWVDLRLACDDHERITVSLSSALGIVVPRSIDELIAEVELQRAKLERRVSALIGTPISMQSEAHVNVLDASAADAKLRELTSDLMRQRAALEAEAARVVFSLRSVLGLEEPGTVDDAIREVALQLHTYEHRIAALKAEVASAPVDAEKRNASIAAECGRLTLEVASLSDESTDRAGQVEALRVERDRLAKEVDQLKLEIKRAETLVREPIFDQVMGSRPDVSVALEDSEAGALTRSRLRRLLAQWDAGAKRRDAKPKAKPTKRKPHARAKGGR